MVAGSGLATGVLCVRVDRRVHELYKGLSEENKELVRSVLEAAILLLSTGFRVSAGQSSGLSDEERGELCRLAGFVESTVLQLHRVLPQGAYTAFQRFIYLVKKLCK